MSFKIFSLQLLGKIKPVEKVEAQRKSLLNDYNEFRQVESSDELKLFYELEKEVNSGDFKQKKSEIQALHFKNSKEYNLLKEYEQLKGKKSIKRYFDVLGSQERKRFESIKTSEKLKEYETLLEYVNEGEFQKEKREIEGQKYKGSAEEKHFVDFQKLDKSPGIKAYNKLRNSQQIARHESLGNSEKVRNFLELKNAPERDKQKKKEFSQLKKDAEIKNYFKFEHSKELKLYRETTDSYNLKQYEELKAYLEKPGFRERVVFLKDKKKFEKAEAFKKWTRFKQLAADSDIQFFLKYGKSAGYKNYLDVKDSFDLKRYLELKEIVSSKEFLERKAYLEDDKKWEKTEEFAHEQKYNELINRPQIVKYFKYKGTDAFAFFREWEVSFEDDFLEGHLNSSKWSVMPLWAEKLLGRNYSLPGDLHTCTLGENVKTGGKLVIETRKEQAEGVVWKMAAGFIPEKFEYTSGLVSSADFSQNDGIFEAKMKFAPVKQVVSSFILQGENNSERVYLLEMGAKNRLGIARTNNSGKLEMEGIDISNLKKDKWYIFTLEKAGGNFTWKINDTEVLNLNQHSVDFSLHINMLTMVIDHVPGSKLPARFQTEWVKCYRRN